MSRDQNANLDVESGVGSLSRRDFAKIAGATGLFAGATDPATADDLRNADRANTTALDEPLRPIDDAFTPREWLTVGPFQYQRRDVDVGWLFPSGDEDDLATGDVTPGAGESLPSAFAGGSSVEWRTVKASGDTVAFPQAGEEIDPTGGDLTPLFGGGGLFDDFQDWFGIGGVLYGIGYAFTTFEMDAPRRAVLETNSDVWLNGHHYEDGTSAVVLEEGTNYLLAKPYLILGLFGSLSLEFRPPEAPVEVDDLAAFRGTPQNVVVPDLRVGEDDTDLPASVRVTNTTGQAVDDATLTFAPDDHGDGDVLVTQEVEIDPPLAPFETRRIDTRVQLPGADTATQDSDGDTDGTRTDVPPSEQAAERAESRTEQVDVAEKALTHGDLGEKSAKAGAERQVADALGGGQVSIELDVDEITVAATVTVDGSDHGRDVPIRVRGEDEGRRQSTFTSRHDESVQTFSYRRPTNYDSGSGPWDLIVSLHGANVPSINQAGANVSREDTFVVAPAARGPVNYDHEDLGRLDDLEAMAVMKERYDVDDDRVFLSGHSMGGHGTWHVGLTNAKHFAAIGPSAGWTDHETYITVVWGRDELHTFPRLKAVKETSLQKNLAMPKTQNAADGTLPVFVLQGGQDTAVPSMQPRSYVRTLANRGLEVDGQVGDRFADPDPDAIDVAYLEVPGAGHWWDKDIGPGNDGVNHPDMWAFMTSATRDPYPDEVTFFTTNLRVEHEKHWVAVLEQETVHAPTKIHARTTDDGVEITTENVARLELDTGGLRESSTSSARRVTVDGRSASLPGADTAVVDLRNGLEVRRGPGSRGRAKGPHQYGPLREVHHDPYRLVYGTRGSTRETAVTRNLANVRSQRLVDRARAPAVVVPDTAVDEATMREYNLVLFGRPSTNAVYDRLDDAFPIRVGDGQVRIGDRTYGGDLAVEFVYPNPRSDRLVQVETGTSVEGLRLTRARNWIPTQVGTADYHVFDRTVRFQRWNASLAAGFFDGHWQVDPELGFLRNVEST